jgi:AraC family transcriptional regulator
MKTIRLLPLLTLLLAVALATALWAEAKEEPPAKIHLKTTEPRAIATMRHQGSFEQIPSVITELMKQMAEGGYLLAGPIMSVYFNDPNQVPEDDLLWEIWIPVAYPGVFSQAENDQMGFKYLDPMFVAYTYHIGPMEKIAETYISLMEWAARNKYNINGPPVEILWCDPGQTPKDKTVTEIWLPVEQKTIPGGVVE